MGKRFQSRVTGICFMGLLAAAIWGSPAPAPAQRQMEILGRGLVAARISSSRILVSWRMLGTDPDRIGFNLYRSSNGGAAVKLNSEPLTATTDYVDTPPRMSVANAYYVRPVLDGVEQGPSSSFAVPANASVPTDHSGNPAPYLSVPLDMPPGGTTPDSVSYTYSANDASIGDLDGDGEYEIVLKWDPSNSHDNAHDGYTGNVFLDAYELDGTRLWRIDLGINIRAGAHYTQFMVYDLDGDGKAEVACKTAEGSRDGQGSFVANTPARFFGTFPVDVNHAADHRNGSGYILTGYEFLTVFDGETGAERASSYYDPPRNDDITSPNVSAWGDNYGNRVDRFLAGVAYLDGVRPSLVMCRGYYTRAVLAAWDWRDGQLTQRWTFDSDTPGNGGYAGQGNHQLSVADVDGDGKDEIVYGACSIDDDGSGLYTTGYNHGDALHVSDMDPDRAGIEVWDVHESGPTVARGGEFRNARAGALIYGIEASGDVGRGLAAHIDGAHVGYQMWSSATAGVLDRTGTRISTSRPSINFVVWWDADLQRELLDNAGGGGANTSLDKWTGNGTTRILSPYSVDAGARNNNSTKSNPCLSGDLLGDWREEILCRSADSSHLMLFITPHPATHRFRTFLHDPQYRVALAWQNVAYNQPPHPGFYVGAGMSEPPLPQISNAERVWVGDGISNVWDVGVTANWRTGGVWDAAAPATFEPEQDVLFDLTGSGSPAVTLHGAIEPSKVTVHVPKAYRFTGPGYLAGTMALLKAGRGALTLDNDNPYRGPTVVTEGVLLVNGHLDHSPVTVKRGVWLSSGIGGAGTLGQGATVEQGGRVYPGNGQGFAGTLTVSNVLMEAGGVVNYFDLSADPAGPGNDLVHVAGDLVLDGVNTIHIRALNGSRPHGAYPLFEYSGTFTGSLAHLEVADLDGYTFGLVEEPGRILLQVTDLQFAPPAAPAAITATPANASVGLTWSTSASAGAYRLKRSIRSGGDYFTIAQVADSYYQDAYVANGITYYYVVSAVNDNGESLNSPQASATPSDAVTYPAEAAAYGDGAVFEDSNAGFHGTGYVNFSRSEGSYLQFDNVHAGAGGNVTLRFRYALGNVARTGRIIVNGVATPLAFESTGTWTSWDMLNVDVTLNPGSDNVVRLESTGNDLANIDELILFGVTVSPPPVTPYFDQAGREGGDVVMRGFAGVPLSDYYFLSSTNLGLPANEWTPVATNQLDGNGLFQVTNALDPLVDQLYFRVDMP